MKLLYRHTHLGEVSEPETDWPWVYAKFSPSSTAEHFRDFFRWMTNEDNFSTEPPFDAALLNEGDWFIEEDGKLRGITVPAFHEDDGVIAWRWR